MNPRGTNVLLGSRGSYQWSPKFGGGPQNAYGMRQDRQSLIDQIITNCERA
jgi:hypothetical protein